MSEKSKKKKDPIHALLERWEKGEADPGDLFSLLFREKDLRDLSLDPEGARAFLSKQAYLTMQDAFGDVECLSGKSHEAPLLEEARSYLESHCTSSFIHFRQVPSLPMRLRITRGDTQWEFRNKAHPELCLVSYGTGLLTVHQLLCGEEVASPSPPRSRLELAVQQVTRVRLFGDVGEHPKLRDQDWSSLFQRKSLWQVLYAAEITLEKPQQCFIALTTEGEYLQQQGTEETLQQDMLLGPIHSVLEEQQKRQQGIVPSPPEFIRTMQTSFQAGLRRNLEKKPTVIVEGRSTVN